MVMVGLGLAFAIFSTSTETRMLLGSAQLLSGTTLTSTKQTASMHGRLSLAPGGGDGGGRPVCIDAHPHSAATTAASVSVFAVIFCLPVFSLDSGRKNRHSHGRLDRKRG